jgi:nitrogen-specific signal transduction histidine kinase
MSEGRLYSISELAELTTLARATVKKRLDGIEPQGGAKNAKTYSLKTALPALIAGASAEMDEAKLRKTQAEASLRELELSVESGEYVPVKEVESQRVKECQWLVNRLQARMPREVAPQLFKAESQAHLAEMLQHEIGRALNEWREL